MGNPETDRVTFPTPEHVDGEKFQHHPSNQQAITDEPPAYYPPAPDHGNRNKSVYRSHPTSENRSITSPPPPPNIARANVEPVIQGTCTCPNCNKSIVPLVKKEIGAKTLAWSIVLGICFLPLMCIPCCIDSLKDNKFYCPECNVCLSDFPTILIQGARQPPTSLLQIASLRFSED